MPNYFRKFMPLALFAGICLLSACDSNVDPQDYAPTRKASEVLTGMVAGNTESIELFVAENGFIQHNPEIAGGRQGWIDAVNNGYYANTSIEIFRNVGDEESEYVFLHCLYPRDTTATVAFEVFRFQDGKIVEHWDNFQELAPANNSGRTMLGGVSEFDQRADTQASKTLAGGFVQYALVGGDTVGLENYFNGDIYLEHAAGGTDGALRLVANLKTLADFGIRAYGQRHAVYGLGDFVLTLSESGVTGTPTAHYDMYRVEDGYIAEHWSVVQTIPPDSTHLNGNGKF